MTRISVIRPRRWARFGVRRLMAFVLLCACGAAGYLSLFEGHRRDWLAEQDAIAQIRRDGGHVGAATRSIGPNWLKRIGGPSRLKYFDRTTALFFVTSDSRLANRHRAAFKYLTMIVQN